MSIYNCIKFVLCILCASPCFLCGEQPVMIENRVDFDSYFTPYQFPENSVERVSSEKCQIWLIRHGESESNAAINDKDKIRIAGRTIDSPLSSKGKDQAQKLAATLKKHIEPFDAYYTSPLSRAVSTTVFIQEIMDIGSLLKDPVRLEALLETDYGFLEGSDGHTYDPYEADMKKTLPLLANFEERMDYRMVPDMESNKEVFDRIYGLVNQLANEHLGQTICLTTHNGPLKAVFMNLAARDFGADVMYHTFSVGNCAALCLESDGQEITLKAFYNISMRK